MEDLPRLPCPYARTFYIEILKNTIMILIVKFLVSHKFFTVYVKNSDMKTLI